MERSLVFYRDFLGMREAARYRGRHGVPDIRLRQSPRSGPDAGGIAGGGSATNCGGAVPRRLQGGDSLDELRAWRERIAAAGVPFVGQSDHRVSQSLYVLDPDGIEIELYVDADPAVWRDNPGAVATIRPRSVISAEPRYARWIYRTGHHGAPDGAEPAQGAATRCRLGAPPGVHGTAAGGRRHRPRQRGGGGARPAQWSSRMVADAPDVEQVALAPERRGRRRFRRTGVRRHEHHRTRRPHAASPPRWPNAASHMLDAPVSGGEAGRDRRHAVDHGRRRGRRSSSGCAPLFEMLGKNDRPRRRHGAGQVAKACNQIVTGIGVGGGGRGASASRARPASIRRKVREALLGGFAYSRILEVHGAAHARRATSSPASRPGCTRRTCASSWSRRTSSAWPCPARRWRRRCSTPWSAPASARRIRWPCSSCWSG
ncbi:MAG: VOC family protein [Comamonadaceae bacterium]|nr:VOC family protein [Comamonadaceae bacterium]